MSQQEKTLTMTATDFAEAMRSVMQSVLEEARKPVLTEQDKKRLEQQQQDRLEGAEREKERREKLNRTRRACSHHRRDGSCRAVFVKGCGDPNLPDGTGSGNFMICQACQAIIRPGVAAPNYDGMDIFDTELFNRLFQAAGVSDILY